MDPLSALSVAASVVAFVDFGGKVLSRYLELKRTGDDLPKSMQLIRADIEGLRAVIAVVLDKAENLRSRYPAQARPLDLLATHCKEAQVQIDKALQKLLGVLAKKNVEAKQDAEAKKLGARKAEAEKSSKAKTAFWSAFKDDEYKELRAQLTSIREEMTMNLLLCLWDETTQPEEKKEKTDAPAVEDTKKAEEDLDAGGPGVFDLRKRRILEAISADQPLQDAGLLEGKWLSEELWDAFLKFDESVITTILDDQFPRGDSNHHTPFRVLDGSIETRILERISFAGIFDRQDRISTPFPATFSWLFDGNSQAGRPPHGFKAWLSSPKDEVPFWITGKPASGKSTLMKFIANHPDLSAILQDWSGNQDLLIASVYFWNPGSTTQKSQHGLLRSLLYQLLRQRPELCRTITPRRYMLNLLESSDPAWSILELRTCLDRFAAQVDGSNRIALFIDGLDEYDGDLPELVSFLVALRKKYRLKLCVSSRPWNVFADAFRTSPSLRMEDLTERDIHTYIDTRFQESAGFLELQQLYPGEVEKLTNEIKVGAQGVFLWVVLVVQELLVEVQDNPQLQVIWQTFNRLPQDLELLYKAIQANLTASQREAASRLFQLTYEWKRFCGPTISATVLWAALEIDDKAMTPVSSVHEEKRLLPVITRLLAGNTRGLLQLVSRRGSEAGVEFLHRTAFDWIRTEENWSKIVQAGPKAFDPKLNLTAGIVAYLRRSHGLYTILGRTYRYNYYYLPRLYQLAARLENTPLNRNRVLELFHQLSPPTTKPPGSITMPRSLPEVPHGHEVWAASFSCIPCLQARIESRRAEEIEAPTLRSPFSRVLQKLMPSERDTAISEMNNLLFSAAIALNPDPEYLDRALKGEKSPYDWLTRDLTPWKASQRLDTVHYLLRAGLAPSSAGMRNLKSLVPYLYAPSTMKAKPCKSIERGQCVQQFCYILGRLLKDFASVDLESLKKYYLPLIEESRMAEEFPDSDDV